ncbi:MAG: DUF3368 domain-containing protein [Anaerolineales bacterium]|nr:DUF3368 domain-containing protein [Anaerolineales bacterium]
MPKVISDSSTLIHLTAIGKLDLLREFYDNIILPTAVWQEVVIEGEKRSGAVEVQQAHDSGWIEILEPSDQTLLRLLKQELHKGEAEAIALALELGADLVLLDETEARKVAELYQLQKTGVVGLLIRAKLQGNITSLRQELDHLQEGSFWINDKLYRRALKSVGEIK